MLEERATVVSVNDKDIWVEVKRQSTCGQCAANKGCGTATLQKVLGNKRNIFRVTGDLSVIVGDEVVIGINEDAVVKGSLLVYALPIVSIITFALIGEAVASRIILSLDRDIASLLGAALGLVVSVLGLRWHSRKSSSHPNYQPVLLRHVSQLVLRPEYKLLG
jgi:sigma-E factor negative regulatory protein RseC